MVKPIKNEQQYEQTLMRVYTLLQKDLKPDSNESDELKLLLKVCLVKFVVIF